MFSCIFYFRQKDPMKVLILRLSSVLMKICKIPHVIFHTTSQIFFKFCMAPQCHELQILCTFLGQTLYTLHRNEQSKYNYFRLLRARIKIHQILVIFETKKFFLQILHHSSVSWDISTFMCPMYFLAEILYTFSKRSLAKYKFGEISSEQLKVWNFALWWATFVKIIQNFS